MSHVRNTYEATYRLLEALVVGGVGRFVVSPGSRSTPLALCASHLDVDVTVIHDERAAAFFALGWSRATGHPSALICTSGTASANYYPAIIEASHAGVPLIALTADRPPEVREFGAGQTIDQVKMFGDNVAWYREMPVMSECPPMHARQVGRRTCLSATAPRPGPVHINVPFREPFMPEPDWRPTPLTPLELTSTVKAVSESTPSLVELAAQTPRGLIVAGHGSLDAAEVATLRRLAEAAAWPIIAEPSSPLWAGAAGTPIVAGADFLLRAQSVATEMVPDVALKVGGGLASRTLRAWLVESNPWRTVLINPSREWNDPTGTATDVHLGSLEPDTPIGSMRKDSEWAQRWRELSDTYLDTTRSTRTKALVAQTVVEKVVASLRDGDGLFVSNSMPIRDLDLFGGTDTPAVRVGVNRGASGIDGVTSCAHGFATGLGRHTTLLIGDIAFLHDYSGLLACSNEIDLTIVVFDDNGGGIFSRLPTAELVDPSDFERLFTTPHDRDLLALALGAGFEASRVTDADALDLALREAREAGGTRIVIASVDATANLDHAADVFARLDRSLR